jgi:hypothetical protein
VQACVLESAENDGSFGWSGRRPHPLLSGWSQSTDVGETVVGDNELVDGLSAEIAPSFF